MTENAAGKRVIKKYPNRRLYDTNESKYVTLNDVRKLVLEETPFCVIDKKSGEDITRNILLQIIIEQEEEGEPLFSTDVLEQLIGFYGNSVQGMAGDFISQSLKLSIFVKHKFSLLEQTHDSPEACNFVSTEPFDRVPVDIVKTVVTKADPFEIRL